MKTTQMLTILVLALIFGGSASADLPENWHEGNIGAVVSPTSASYDEVTDTWTVPSVSGMHYV